MLQVLANGLCTGAVFALTALGFALVYSTTRVFHIAHGASFVIGAFAGYLAVTRLDLPVSVALVVAGLTAGLFGLVVEIALLRPLQARRGSSEIAMVASLGAYVVVANCIALFAGNETRFLRQSADATLSFSGVSLATSQVLQVGVAGLAIALVAWTLKVTQIGRNWRAIADNTRLASLVGIDVGRARALAVGVGSALAGIAGCLQALTSGTDPNVGFQALLIASVAAIVGGLRSYLGPPLGGILIGLLQAVGSWYTSARWESTFTFSLLLITLMVRPWGLIARRRRLEEQ